jgi:hypothetical protein
MNSCGTSSTAALPKENVVIPTNHLHYCVVHRAANRMRSLDGYQLRRGLIEYLILLMCDINQSVSHYIFGIAKCTTIRLGVLLEGFTYKNVNANTKECPSWNVAQSISAALPETLQFVERWNESDMGEFPSRLQK